MTYDELPTTPAPNTMLYCPHCGAEYSACRGDYFLVDPHSVIHCGSCTSLQPLVLVKRVVEYREVAR